MPKESDKATISSFTGVGLVRVVDDSAGTPASRNMTPADLLTEMGGGGGGASTLDGLTDVVITAAASGDILRHNGTNWVDTPGTDHYVAATAMPVELGFACSDETTAIDAAGQRISFRMPFAMTLTAVRASVNSACSTGTLTIDIEEGGTTVLSTALTIDATEKTSTTAATAAVISDSALADDAEITIDVDDEGDGTATGLKVWLIGTRSV